MARYPTRRSALMPVLYLAQAEEGHVSRDGMRRVAELLGITTAEVEAVVTFYTMYQRPPCGRYVLSVCTNLSCALLGGKRLFERAIEILGEEANHGVSGDGAVTLHEEECLAACDGAPVVQVNFANYERVTEGDLEALIDALRRGEPPAPVRGDPPKDLRETSLVLAGHAAARTVSGAPAERDAVEPTGHLGRMGEQGG